MLDSATPYADMMPASTAPTLQALPNMLMYPVRGRHLSRH